MLQDFGEDCFFEVELDDEYVVFSEECIFELEVEDDNEEEWISNVEIKLDVIEDEVIDV